jgi:cleavage and polyadenylation specificity factor subunit 1
VWQPVAAASTNANGAASDTPRFTLLPTGHVLPNLGQVAHVSTVWPLSLTHVVQQQQKVLLPGCFDKPMLDGLLDDGKLSATVAGLILIGSRLGDSHLVALGCEGQPTKDEAWSVWNIVPNDQDSVKEKEAIVKGEAPLVKQEDNSAATLTAYEAMLQREEEALYTEPDVVPGATSNGPLAKKPKSQQPDLPWTVLKAMTILDTLVHLGPLGPSHTGPIAATPPFMRVPVDATVPNSDDVVTSAPARVFPVGFGSSGGLAWAALPGRDDRMIVSEKDCLNVECIFGLPTLSMVLLGMIPDATTGEGKPLRLLHATPDSLTEVDLEEQAPDCAHLFQGKLLQAGEFRTTGYFAVLVQHDPGADTFACIMKIHDGRITLIKHVSLPVDAVLCQVAPFVAHYDYISTVFVWQSGEATLVQLDIQGNLSTVHFANDAPVEAMKIDDEQNEDEDEEDRALRDFYAQKDIVAADFFTAPRGLFDVPAKPVANGAVTPVDGSTSPRDGISSDMDEDDMELYGMAPPVESSVSLTASPEPPTTEQACFLALCRQSGELEIHLVSDKEVSSSLVWSCQGLSQGFATLGSSVAPDSFAKSHKVQVSELRFFSCGLTLSKKTAALSGSSLRSFCLAVETSAGDVFVYQVGKDTVDGVLFIRQPLALVVRSSQEQANHRKKLSRKGIIAKDADTVKSPFVHSTLFPFRDLSGQDGLFVSTPRPFWLVAERGYPSVVYHRARHAAPAGGKPKIMNGFCSIGEGRFMTLHERVGRVGSQRLTLFDGISKVFQSQGVLAGGLCIERQILGVTVRRVEFIDDPDISTGDRPLYAVLVSREIEVDQSHLNDDGLLPEEREEAKKEKEKAKTQRQVEADLGGFDFEHEWVEEITREDVFQVDQDLGGAPPILKQAYSLWIVDAANKWQIVDAYDLDEYEHGVTLSIMSLSNFKEEPGKGSGNEEEGVPEDLDLTLFIMVGTGTVDHNGEDVTGKGRALLFTLLRRGALGVSLQLASEKEIFHGAVTTLDCLSVEGKNRLILGAGADVNVEQWGNGKLTQVGFFRATMHIADIRIFKNFLLLSDAYDSLHMLIYRESDKSLTLLAKEYEPVAVYATGVMSRAQSMSFLLHDDRMNLQFLQYAPGEAAARGGNKLVCRADFHLGTQTIGFGSHFCRNSLLIHSATPTSTLAALQQQDSYTGRADDDQRIAANFGTTDGTLGAVVPLSEPVYWRLTALQSVLANALESDGGLSPRAWRLYRRSPRRGGCRSNERKKSVIDGDLVRRYADLPTRTQEDLASAVGSTVGLILDNLLELECGSLVL